MSIFHLFNYSTSTVDSKQVSSIYNVIGVSLELLHRDFFMRMRMSLCKAGLLKFS
jgi:hypothetical protein